ncbi:hypothetical protein ACFL0X_00710 [Nanoarchaeota archaeon]
MLQCLLLMNLPISNSYFLNQIFPVVSAEEMKTNCCLETKNGAKCQNVLSSDSSCENPLPSKCEEISYCKLGCCINEKEGFCTKNSPKLNCEDNEGRWEDSGMCSVAECELGCCVINNNAQLTTGKRCEQLSLSEGVEKDFRLGVSEFECVSIPESFIEGACILEEGICSRKTETECLAESGEFHEGWLCSHESLKELGVVCIKQETISCFEGEDEIYWFDSCGNRENIYSDDKDKSWNNGRILEKENSCNPFLGNIYSETCGNCDRFLGSKCFEAREGDVTVKDGDYICRDLTCEYVDQWGSKSTKQNGESWCVYDGKIGEGKDPVGSRHWRFYCSDGEIKSEPCADYRGEICVQSEIIEGDNSFLTSSCVINEGSACLTYNEEEKETMREKCEKNLRCNLKEIKIDRYFNFDLCVAKYPKGFDLKDVSGSNNFYCSLGSRTCTMIYEKNLLGELECKKNCDCKKGEFVEQMNDLCISLGDCGTYINYKGVGTENIEIKSEGDQDISWERYEKYSNPIKGQNAKPVGPNEFLSSISGKDLSDYTPEQVNEETYNWASGIIGATGTLANAGAWTMVQIGEAVFAQSLAPTSAVVGASAGFSAFGAVISAAAIGMSIGYYLSKSLGLGRDATITMIGLGTYLGLIWGSAWAVYILGSSIPVAGWIGVAIYTVIIASVMTYISVVGWGQTEIREVEFTCMPWQAPLGGRNCDKCNEDILRPCTKYRCESLGAACVVLNQGIEENPVCIDGHKNDATPPVIFPVSVSEGYEFEEKENGVKVREIDGECIPEFTPVTFVFGTDEYAQCKWNVEPTNPDEFEEKGEYSLEQNLFTKNHTLLFFMPSLESLEMYNATEDLKDLYGNLNLFIRCRDYNGNPNTNEYLVNFCVNDGPDLTPVDHSQTIMEPVDETFLKYDVEELELTMQTNEPAECSYSSTPNTNYENMEHQMNCVTDLSKWFCKTTLTGLNEGENKFYFRCKDQPLKTNESERNVNTEDFEYSLYVSKSELKIDSISPSGEVGSEIVDLEVVTSGGAKENGVCSCEYKWGNNWIFFESTNSNSHTQRKLELWDGEYDIGVRCEDDAGNVAEENTLFEVAIDNKAPKVVRVFKEEGSLKLITNEEAKCSYDLESCDFNIEEAESMTVGNSKEHSAPWYSQKTYYIKCKDVFGNLDNDCSIIVKPNSF